MTQLSVPSAANAGAQNRPAVVDELRALSLRALRRMYVPSERRFVFRCRRASTGVVSQGVSGRYTAIVLIGLAAVGSDDADAVLGDTDVGEVIGGLLEDVDQAENVGDAALTLWAAVAWNDARADRAAERLAAMRPWDASISTVELAWAVTAFSLHSGRRDGDPDRPRRAAERLKASFNERTELFPHWPVGAASPWSRRHVSCFADLVYPVQALAHFHAAFADERMADVARRGGDRMCALQGEAGQWWWHFDVRTGRVIEGYPVYAVHQDAMAPMALFDVDAACGTDHRSSIDGGMRWLVRPAEGAASLIDREADLIWRKVFRREPRKLVRALQASASRMHASLRMPATDVLFPPTATDFECRPYHLGWLLYAWAKHPQPR